MLTAELVNNTVPRLHLQDSVGKALQLMNDFRATHLPVVAAEERYLGLLSEEDLLDIDDDRKQIEILQDNFIMLSVKEDEHFLTAVNFSNQFETNIVPVINQDKGLTGVITTVGLLKRLGDFSGAAETGSIIVLEMERAKFAISEISRIVESNDSAIMHLNTTIDEGTGLLAVTLHLNKKEIAAIVAAFERYEYHIVYYFGNEKFTNEIHDNFQHLMNYLDI